MTTVEDVQRMQRLTGGSLMTDTKTLCAELRFLLATFEQACQANRNGEEIKNLTTKIQLICRLLEKKDDVEYHHKDLKR